MQKTMFRHVMVCVRLEAMLRNSEVLCSGKWVCRLSLPVDDDNLGLKIPLSCPLGTPLFSTSSPDFLEDMLSMIRER